jgi:hypothetical protein
MTTYTVNGLGQFNNTIPAHLGVGGTLVAADVIGQPNSELNVSGIDNLVGVVDSPDSIVRLTGNSNHAIVESSPDTMTFLNGVANSVFLTSSANGTVHVVGVNNVVITSSPGAAADDRGPGTIFTVEVGNLTIKDFASDPTGKVELQGTPAQDVAAEQSDGHGGTLISLGNTTVDFARVPHVDISHFL